MKYQFQAPCTTKYRDPKGNEHPLRFGIGDIIDVVPRSSEDFKNHPMTDDLSFYLESKREIPLVGGAVIIEFCEPSCFKHFHDLETLRDDQILIDAQRQEIYEKYYRKLGK
jgi:hypothetical protein